MTESEKKIVETGLTEIETVLAHEIHPVSEAHLLKAHKALSSLRTTEADRECESQT